MGLFSTFKDGLSAIGHDLTRRKTNRSAQEEYVQLQETLREYRSRGIFVLAVYADGILWNYFHYPSEVHRTQAANEFWPPIFDGLGVSCDCKFLDPK